MIDSALKEIYDHWYREYLKGHYSGESIRRTIYDTYAQTPQTHSPEDLLKLCDVAMAGVLHAMLNMSTARACEDNSNPQSPHFADYVEYRTTAIYSINTLPYVVQAHEDLWNTFSARSLTALSL